MMYFLVLLRNRWKWFRSLETQIHPEYWKDALLLSSKACRISFYWGICPNCRNLNPVYIYSVCAFGKRIQELKLSLLAMSSMTGIFTMAMYYSSRVFSQIKAVHYRIFWIGKDKDNWTQHLHERPIQGSNPQHQHYWHHVLINGVNPRGLMKKIAEAEGDKTLVLFLVRILTLLNLSNQMTRRKGKTRITMKK